MSATGGRGRGRGHDGRARGRPAGTAASSDSSRSSTGDWRHRGGGSGASAAAGSSQGRQAAAAAPAGHLSTSDLRASFKARLRRLTAGQPRRPSDLAWLIQHAFDLLDDDELLVLEALGSNSRASSSSSSSSSQAAGLELLRDIVCSTAIGPGCKLVLDCPPGANSMQANNSLPFQACFLPLLRLITDPRVQTSPHKQFTNSIYTTLFHELDHKRTAAVIQQLFASSPALAPSLTTGTAGTAGAGAAAAGSPAAAGTAGASTSAGLHSASAAAGPPGSGGGAAAGLAGCWVPKDWLDVLEPFVWYQVEVLRRFREDGAWQQRKEGIQLLWDVVQEHCQRYLAAGGGAGAARKRRLQASLEQLAEILGARVRRDAALNTLQVATRQRAAAAQAAAAQSREVRVLPSQLPGALRQPGGPRHDNDHVNFRLISIPPTQQQVLCDIPPYLPRNRPGGALVAEGVSLTDAHLDLHFRLPHHDLLADLIDVVGQLRERGGIAGLDAQQKARNRGSRVDFGSTSLNVYRRVGIEQLCAQPNTGIYFEVSFAEPPFMSARSSRDKLEFWKTTKQLEHGSLIALWYEPSAQGTSTGGQQLARPVAAAVDPQLIFATVVDRDARKLAGQFVPGSSYSSSGSVAGSSAGGGARCRLGISLCHAARDNELLVQACLGRTQFSGACEVLLIQASNSYFAYQPILKALQQMQTLPMAQYLVPGLAETGPSNPIPVPAYLADAEAHLNLSSICDTQLAARHPSGQGAIIRLRRVPVNRLSGFPLEDLLMACTTLDRPQAAALKAGLTQEFSLIQGPPGTGKTYVGILLVKLLLANTSNSQSGAAPSGRRDVRPGPAGVRLPDVGPILMVTVTNHAIDSLMEGLLNAGVATRPGDMIRVGGRSKSERLQPYNLKELTQPAGGAAVAKCKQAIRDAHDNIQTKLQQLKRARDDRLHWKDVRPLLLLDAPQLVASLDRRQDQLQQFISSGCSWQAVDSSAAGRAAAAAAKSGDVLGHWKEGDPESDWRFKKDVEAAVEEQLRKEEMRQQGLEGWDTYMSGYELVPGMVQSSAVPLPVSNLYAALALDSIGSDLLSAPNSVVYPPWPAFPGHCQPDFSAQQPMQQMQPTAPGEVTSPAPSPAEADVAPESIRQACSRHRELGDLVREVHADMFSRDERQLLLQHLKEQLVGGFADALASDVAALDRANKELRQVYDSRDLQTLRRARVVGMTTSGVARLQGLVAALQPKVLLVEEAGELLEAHMLASLSPATEHVILIGDHEQLRPKPQYYPLEAASGRGYDLDVSAFERLARGRNFPVVTLEEQRRMRPDISRLIRAPIYPNLRDHNRVLQYPAVKGMAQPLFMLAHSHLEGGQGSDEGRSKFNTYEVDMAVALARYLMQQGYNREGDLVILTPYVGQLQRIKRAVAASNMRVILSDKDSEELAALEEADLAVEAEAAGDAAAAAGGAGASGVAHLLRSGSGSSGTGGGTADSAGAGGSGSSSGNVVRVVDMNSCLRLATIDNFQGEEATVVILSLVRSRPDGNIGFLRLRNRINVLLSRAKHGMYILANPDTLRAAAAPPPEGSRRPAAPMWGQVLEMLEERGQVGRELEVVCQKHGNHTRLCSADDFKLLVSDGGCQLACGERLPCGHACPRRCHADDPGHQTTRCLEPCTRLCAAGAHPCRKLCNQQCGQCSVAVNGLELPCGHVADGVPCYMTGDLGRVPCQAQVTICLPTCGHTHTLTCSEAHQLAANPHTCPFKVQLQLPACGHMLTCSCGEAAAKLLDPRSCTEPCGALLPGCLHACEASCGSCMGLSLQQLLEQWVGAIEQQHKWLELAAVCKDSRKGSGGPLQLLTFMQGGQLNAAAAARGTAGQDGYEVIDTLAGGIGAAAAASSSISGGGGGGALGSGNSSVLRRQLAASWLDWLQQLQGGSSSSSGIDSNNCTSVAPGAASTTSNSAVANATSTSSLPSSSSSSSNSLGRTTKGTTGTKGLLIRLFGAKGQHPAGFSSSSAAAAAAARVAVSNSATEITGSYSNTTGSTSSNNNSNSTSSVEIPALHLPTSFTRSHPSCKHNCGRLLSCGHPCSSSCHEGKPCPPCKQKCPVACPHTRCGQPCAKPCYPCAEPCTWRCKHQGACSLPCGAPCDRLPCNVRCEKKLKCGHVCPGLCGEACLEGACIHPACRAKVQKAKPQLMQQVVDQIMLTTFAELDDSAVNQDPLLLLPCGHIFTTSSLDGWIDMGQAYHAADAGSGGPTFWCAAKTLPGDVWSPKSCPAGGCPGLVVGLKRYGRPGNKALLDLLQRKHLEQGMLQCKHLAAQLQSLAADVSQASRAPALAAGIELLARCRRLAGELETGLQQQQKPPTGRVHEGCLAALKCLEAAQLLEPQEVAARQQVLLVPRPDTSLCSRFVQGIAFSAEQHLRVLQLLLDAAVRQLQEMDSSTVEHAGGGRGIRPAFGRGGGWGRGRLPSRSRATNRDLEAAEGQVFTMLLDSTAKYLEATALLDQQLAAANAASCYRGTLTLRLAHMQLAVQRVMQLQSLKPARVLSLLHQVPARRAAAAGAVAAGAHELQKQALAAVLGMQPGQAPPGPDSLSGRGSWKASLDASLSLSASPGEWSKMVHKVQREIVQQVEELGIAALAEHAAATSAAASSVQQGASSSSSSTAAAGQANPEPAAAGDSGNTSTAIEALLARLPEVLASVDGDVAAAEMAEVLQAMYRHEFGRGYGDVASFMRGHLYQCPRGHMYVIGECGGAMQSSRCPECGSIIGGGGHQLAALNQHADEGVMQLLGQAFNVAAAGGSNSR